MDALEAGGRTEAVIAVPALRDRHPTRMITVRLRRDQHQKILAQAAAAKQSMNQYVLDTLLPPPRKLTHPFSVWFAELANVALDWRVRRGITDGDPLEPEQWRWLYEENLTPQEAWEGRPKAIQSA